MVFVLVIVVVVVVVGGGEIERERETKSSVCVCVCLFFCLFIRVKVKCERVISKQGYSFMSVRSRECFGKCSRSYPYLRATVMAVEILTCVGV